MFVGREAELRTLEQAYAADSFQMVVVYGRRRVGKTTLLAHFASDKPALFFTAQQQSDVNNLSDFSAALAQFFNLPEGMAFGTWKAAFDYISERAQMSPFLLVFDEFPYAAAANRGLLSILQTAIDHQLSRTKLCLVLCGSDQGFMESDVLGKKSPLHGRRTAQINLRPFDYLTAAKMLDRTSDEDAFKYYACIGGIPYYLARIDQARSFTENIARLFFDANGFLYAEPMMLLRQELREPALYNSVLRAIGSGANRQSEIADRAGIEVTAVAKYLKTLLRLDIVERIVPFGENAERSRRGLYRFADGCYDFWYTFVMPAVGDIEEGAGRIVAEHIPDGMLAVYLGRRFERVCAEWMVAESLAGALPISASGFGSWWGTDPATRTQHDIDVVAVDRFAKEVLIGECKWRNAFNETEAMEKLVARGSLLKGYHAVGYYLFSKRPLSDKTLEKMKAAGTFRSVTLAGLYERRR